MTLDDEEAERVFGGLRREFQLDLLEFRNDRDFQKTLDTILEQGKVRNLRRTGKTILKDKGQDYFEEVYPSAHRNARRRIRELKRRPLTFKRSFRGRVIVSKRWTASDTEKLRMLWPRKDESAKSIGFILNRTPKSVSRRAETLRLRKLR